jgi:hypothetical protein
MKASINEHINAVRMLVERSVDMVAQNIFGDTGLAIAIRYEKLEIARAAHMLIERGA